MNTALLILALACGGKGADDTGPTTDGGAADGGAADGGEADGGATDGGASDGGATDGGDTDGGDTDGGATDGGDTDGGDTDGGSETDWTVHCTRGAAALTDPLLAWPSQGAGPYWRSDMPERTELNVRGAAGQPLVVDARLVNTTGAPLAGRTVHLWSAGPDGAYDVTSDDFQLYGATTTAADGTFCVHTLRPANYGDGSGGLLAQHLHMAVLDGGMKRATPHAHFADDPELEDDPQPEQTVVAVEDLGDGNQRISFDLVLD